MEIRKMLKTLKSISFKATVAIISINALIITAKGWHEYKNISLKNEKFKLHKAEQESRIERRSADLELDKAEREVRMEAKKAELAARKGKRKLDEYSENNRR